MTRSLRDMVPTAHRRLLPVLFDRPTIDEPRATCDDCVMCAKPGTPHEALVHFRADTKCCTYQPSLPNFLVGAVLADESPEMAEGRRRMKQYIAARMGVTPYWVAPSRKTRVLLEAARGTSFGRSRVLLCSFFADEGGGQCTIWRHRESVCSTFFCKHEKGAVADAFWKSEKRLLGKVELILAREAARSVSSEVTEPQWPRHKLTVQDLEDRPPTELDYLAAWASWAGREEEFYRACHAFVATLKPSDVETLLEQEEYGVEILADVERAYGQVFSTEIGEMLVPNPEMRTAKTATGMAVTTYSTFDSMELSTDLYDVVNEFRATETVAETRSRLLAERELAIPDDLLLALVQHQILVPPRPP